MTPDDAAIERVLTRLAVERGEGSFCPSDAARRLSDLWRPLMPEVRRVAAAMQAAGTLQATQRGRAVDPLTARGAIRLRLPQASG